MLKKITVLSVCYFLSFVLSSHANAWVVPGTDIFSCYTDTEEMLACPSPGESFYGQNGNYSKLHLFRDESNGTVTDLVTKLLWQKTPETTERNWSDAATYCADLVLGESQDWRIPTIRELMTIVYNGNTYPPRFNRVFEGNIAYYWSSTTVAPDISGYAWTVDFGEGDTHSWPKVGTNMVRCVHGDPLGESVFVDNDDGTVTDQTTRLVWEKMASASAMTWENALAYCENQTTGGHDDWRMPNIQELNCLVDFSRIFPAPAINPVFPVSTNPFESSWSSSTFLDGSGYVGFAWYITFDHGRAWYDQYKTNPLQVRCVRDLATSPQSPASSALLLLLQ